MLIVDEVHHLLAGSHIEQRASLNLLKYLANDLRISVVAVGTSDAPLALRTDPQMSSRFTPFEMPRWAESDDFRRLLRAFEQVLPLRRASDLVQRPVVQFRVSASGGLLGEVSRLLTEAAERAIVEGSERISLEHLERAAYEPG
jgi:AAA+ superfamily predicted ATPase